MKKDNIVLTITSIWVIRNFLLTDLFNRLTEKYNIYVITKTEYFDLLQKHGIYNVINIEIIKYSRIDSLIFAILQEAFSMKNKYLTVSGIKNMSFKSSESYKLIIQKKIIYIISKIVIISKTFNWLEEKWINNVQRKISIESLETIKSINPKFYFSTSFAHQIDRSILLIAMKLNIRSIIHVLSFDNITSRGYLPYKYFDIYMVWNKKMKKELVNLYNIDSKKIFITGTPQFIFNSKSHFSHKNKDIIYKEFLIPNYKKYIVYAGNHFAHTPSEPDLLNYIINTFKKIDEFSDIHWILRFHPLDNFSRWDDIIEKNDNLSVSIPWQKTNIDGHISIPKVEDLLTFSSILEYAFCVFNVSSTITIDASIQNTPSFCIGFHPFDKNEGNYYYNVHFSNHYSTILNFGASPLIVNINQLISELKQLKSYDKYEQNRISLKNFYIGDTLDNSVENIVQCILNFDKNV